MDEIVTIFSCLHYRLLAKVTVHSRHRRVTLVSGNAVQMLYVASMEVRIQWIRLRRFTRSVTQFHVPLV